jgi:hypothetical protein
LKKRLHQRTKNKKAGIKTFENCLFRAFSRCIIGLRSSGSSLSKMAFMPKIKADDLFRLPLFFRPVYAPLTEQVKNTVSFLRIV